MLIIHKKLFNNIQVFLIVITALLFLEIILI